MTKNVRVENADTSDYKVVVQVWDKGYPEGAPDTLAKEVRLDYPADMTGNDVYLTSTRYLVVKEVPQVVRESGSEEKTLDLLRGVAAIRAEGGH